VTTRRKTEAGPEPNLPVTPMLDMAFQLLAFFVMTYHPSSFEGQMELSLPSEPVAQAQKPDEMQQDAKPDKDEKLEPQASLTVFARTNNGLISDVVLQDTAGSQQADVPATNPERRDPRQMDKLRDELKKRRENAENKDNIKIQADSKLKWKEVMKVIDVCKSAGFKNISFVPPPG
jgi:biopolymer transport protein ExbD